MRRLAFLLAGACCTFAQPGGTVSGRVVSALDGSPVAGAQVTLRGMEADRGAAPQTYLVETGSDGRFSAEGIAPGVYDPRPRKLGYEARPPNRFATARDFPPFTVQDGKTVAAIELRLIPDGVISGRVLDSEGDPVRRATVEALQYRFARGKKELSSAQRAQTDDHGEYRLFNLPPGRYYLRAQHQRQGCQIFMFGDAMLTGCNGGSPVSLGPAFYPAAVEVSHSSELTVAPGAELSGIDIHVAVRALYSIYGKFEGASGAGRSTSMQLLTSQGEQTPFDLKITDDGFALNDVPSGAYRLVADSSTNAPAAGDHLFATQAVEVVNHDVETPLVFSKGYKVTIALHVEGGAAISREESANIRFIPVEGGAEAQAQLAADGSVAATVLAPGVYRVAIVPTGIYLKAVRMADKELHGRVFDPAKLTGPLTLIAGAGRGQIEGTVVDESGKPVYNADVTILRDGDDEWQDRFKAVFTKSDGKFKFDEVIPGEYKAYAWLAAPPGEPQNPEFRRPYESRAVVVSVKPNHPQSVQLNVIVIQ